MTKFHDLTPAQALAAQEDRLDTLIVPLEVQPKPGEHVIEHPKQPGVWLVGTSFHRRVIDLPFAPDDRIVCREAHYLTDDGHTEFAVYAADEIAVQKHLDHLTELTQIDPDVLTLHRAFRTAHTMPEWASRLTLEVTGVTVRKDDAGQWAAHYEVTKV